MFSQFSLRLNNKYFALNHGGTHSFKVEENFSQSELRAFATLPCGQNLLDHPKQLSSSKAKQKHNKQSFKYFSYLGVFSQALRRGNVVTDNDATSGKEAHDSVNSIMYFGKSVSNTKVGREEFKIKEMKGE